MVLLSITRSLSLVHSIHITTHAHRSASATSKMMLLLLIIVLSGASSALMHIAALTLFKLLFFEFDRANFPIHLLNGVFEFFLSFLSFF